MATQSPSFQAVIEAMEALAPLHYAEEWDNVGLILGAPEQAVRGPVILTIDVTEAVVHDAIRAGASAIVSYHPPIFKPIKRLTARSPAERALLAAARAGLAVYSPHTALDAAPGGMTDWLADGLLDRTGQIKADRRALRPWVAAPENEEVKVVTFVPENKLEDLRNALATAGAGQIGHYHVCSFAVRGTGTFYGETGTHPTVGQAGRLETADEHRLEMVCARRALPLALATLRQFHPYEEPAIDVYELRGKPVRAIGAGRRLVLDQPATLEKIVSRLKTHLDVRNVKVAPGPGMALSRNVSCVGVCPGAGADLAPAALADGCEVYVTGEMRYHEVIPMLDAGLSIILAGHTNTERGYLPRLAEYLKTAAAGIEYRVSAADVSPFVIL